MVWASFSSTTGAGRVEVLYFSSRERFLLTIAIPPLFFSAFS
jgi:hypothetical protein